MKKILLATVAVVVLAGAANAADMVVKAPVYKDPVWTWDGVYVGGHVGYSWGKWDSSCPFFNCFLNSPGSFVATSLATSPAALAGFLGSFGNQFTPNVDGWLGGIHIGRNWQYQNFVVGVEWDFDGTREKANRDGTAFVDFRGPNDDRFQITTRVTMDWKFNWFSTLRGRVGVAGDTWLAYLTGGLAVGQFEYSATNTTTVLRTNIAGTTVLAGGGAFATALSEKHTRWGGAIGAGVEKAFTKNLIARVEYLYLDFGTHRFFDGVNQLGAFGTNRWDTDIRLRDHIVRVGLSYKFDPWIVAKY